METLTRAGIAESVHRDVGLSRTESGSLINAIFEAITDSLSSGENVKISSFGTFVLRDKKQRSGRNPKTGEEFPIKARRVLVFRASQVMKDLSNKV